MTANLLVSLYMNDGKFINYGFYMMAKLAFDKLCSESLNSDSTQKDIKKLILHTKI